MYSLFDSLIFMVFKDILPFVKHCKISCRMTISKSSEHGSTVFNIMLALERSLQMDMFDYVVHENEGHREFVLRC